MPIVFTSLYSSYSELFPAIRTVDDAPVDEASADDDQPPP